MFKFSFVCLLLLEQCYIKIVYEGGPPPPQKKKRTGFGELFLIVVECFPARWV